MPLHVLLWVITLIGLIDAREAQACVCGISANCSGAATAAAVFEGTVEAVEASPIKDSAFGALGAVRFANVKTYRGERTDAVFTLSAGNSCAFPFRVGVRYLIVAGKSQGGLLIVTYCGLTRRIEAARGLIEFVNALKDEPIQTRIYGEVLKAAALRDERRPVAGVEVTLHGPRETVVKTDSNGRFIVRGLAHGSYSASARIPGSQAIVQSYFSDFELSPGVPHACAELMFEVLGTGQVTGLVVDERGEPMARAFVYLHAVNETGTADAVIPGQGTEADEVGRYYFFDVPPGRYQVSNGGSKGLGTQIVASATDGSTTFFVRDDELVTLETLEWRRFSWLQTPVIVRNVEGVPVPGVDVQSFIFTDGNEPYAAGAGTSGADGKVVMTLLKDRRYRLVAGPRQAPRSEVEVPTADGQPLTILIRR